MISREQGKQGRDSRVNKIRGPKDLLGNCDVGWRSAVVGVGLERGRDDQGRARRRHGERDSEGGARRSRQEAAQRCRKPVRGEQRSRQTKLSSVGKQYDVKIGTQREALEAGG
jgi:hypothetical protein